MKILCSGFYGYGNAGDEAIARCLDRYLNQPFENTEIEFSTDMSYDDAQKVKESNTFYKERSIISSYDLDDIKSKNVVIVGGGDLPRDFGLDQVAMAKQYGKTSIIARIGTSARDDFLQGEDKDIGLVKESYGSFDYVSVRDRASYDVLGSIGIKAHLGADLAIDMMPNRDIDIPKKPYAIFVMQKEESRQQEDIARSIHKAMKRCFESVLLVPFGLADESYCENLAEKINGLVVLKTLWSDPAKLQWIIANAEYVVSVGKLHPLVFSIGARRPCYAVTYPKVTGYDRISAMMQQCGIGHRVSDWEDPPEEIGERVFNAIQDINKDRMVIDVYSGHLKGLMLESICPVLTAMKAKHGLGVERGMKAGQFEVTDYDDSYYFGARLFRYPNGEFVVYNPSRGDWGGWDVVKDLIVDKMKPGSLLDVGCGRGWFLKRMIESGVKSQGIDMSAAAWSESAPGMQQHMIVGDLKEVENQCFDVVTAFDIMEHIFEEDIVDAIKSLKERAGKYIVFNICAAPDNEEVYTIRKNETIPQELEWLAVSGHVTIRHRSWWKSMLEDDKWESDEEMTNDWFANPDFNFISWARHNVIILRKR